VSLTTTAIENLYRQPYEAYAAAAWGAAGVLTAGGAIATGVPWTIGVAMTGTSFGLAAVRAWQTWRLLEAKFALAGQQFWLLPVHELDKAIARNGDRLWLGRGFRWQAKHTERAREIKRMDLEMVLPPKWLLRLVGKPHDDVEIKGAPWIHGVEPNEHDVTIPWGHSEGNWSLFGTTGAGKTRLYELLAYQVIKRGDVLVVIDPKYDKDLGDTLRRACLAAGRPNAFGQFHPAFPDKSVRIDPMKNFTRDTEHASRVAELLGNDPDDNFVAFCWRTMHAIDGGLLYIEERPSLKKMRYYIEAGPEELLEKVLTRFFNNHLPGRWESHVQALQSQLENASRKVQPRLKTGTPRQAAMVQFYHENVPRELKAEEVTGLISVAEHSREHLGKMITGLLPLLTKLTVRPLDALLSPDYDDPNDTREILDSEKIVRGGRVLHIVTDSLSDSAVGTAIAGIILADLRAYAGAIYNYGADSAKRVHVLVDEAYEVVNEPLISLMNKGRGAGFITYLATQNFSDYVARFGDEHRARMVLGNGNNRLTLRVTDNLTQKYVAENLGTVDVRQTSATMTSGSKTEDGGMEFSGNMGTSVGLTETEVFPAALLGELPDLHYVAVLSGGKRIKGRLAKIVWGAKP
jgi:conjugal transfer pilus assembly protein TraD